MKPLNQSVAGIRGIWGENLTPDAAVRFAAAFGTYLKHGKVLIGRDTRASGELLTHAVIVGLSSVGCDVTDVGIVPTPTCQLAVEKNVVNGGIVITASHNPGEWNGLKFLDREGHFLNQAEYEKFMAIFESGGFKYVPAPTLVNLHQGRVFNKEVIELHMHELLKHVDVEAVRARKYKVVLDAVNGAGSRLLLPLLEKLNCTTVPLYCDESGQFPRGAEPMPENITALCEKVVEEKADLGLAVDPDADRLSLVTETGRPLGEEMTLPLCAHHILSRKAEGTLVTNMSTSMALEHVAKEFGIPVIRTKIGEAHVVSGMKENNCVIGGEGNGGIIYPAVHYARDTGVGTVLILDSMARSGKTLSQLAEPFPEYVMVKKKMDVPLEAIPGILEMLKADYGKGAEINTLDGVKLIWEDKWLHVRKSGTEGMLRIFTEATDGKTAETLADEAIGKIRKKLS